MWRIGALALVVAAAVTVALARGPAPESGTASSHREAPLISEDPAADNTDVYAFVSPDRPDTVTIVANYIPLEEPAGGPNFNSFADDVRYELKVDNTGDGADDITYRFRFRTKTRNGNTFLYNTGPIETLSDPDWNRPQFYSVTRIANGRKRLLARTLPTPPVNIGPRSTPGYGSLMAAAVHELPGGIKAWAGQADDPFFVDLGSVFDLAGLRPFNGAHVLPLAPENGVDGVGGFNTHSIVLQVPIAQLTRDREMPTGADDPEAVIGVYASASRRRIQILNTGGRLQRNRGPWVQVSRLAEPLVNEVLIPLRHKDKWNARDPERDSAFASNYTSPEVTRLANALYPALDDAPESGRGDIAAVLLTGVPGLNFTGPTQADLIRLNTGIPPSGPVGTGNRLGLLGGEFAGFPNGRRLEDDVVDIELRALTCGYGPVVGPIIESFGFCAGNANRTPNNQLGDGVDANDRPLHVTFPYVGEPSPGYEHAHHGAPGGP
jgi:Domain of unknown function (DUF4331)